LRQYARTERRHARVLLLLPRRRQPDADRGHSLALALVGQVKLSRWRGVVAGSGGRMGEGGRLRQEHSANSIPLSGVNDASQIIDYQGTCVVFISTPPPRHWILFSRSHDCAARTGAQCAARRFVPVPWL